MNRFYERFKIKKIIVSIFAGYFVTAFIGLIALTLPVGWQYSPEMSLYEIWSFVIAYPLIVFKRISFVNIVISFTIFNIIGGFRKQ